MRRFSVGLFVLALVLPALAFANNANSVLVVDFTTGPVADFLGKTRGLAFGLLGFTLVAGLLVEAFGRGPAAPRDYSGVLFRFVLVLTLLTFYSRIFGSFIGLAEGVANRVAPASVWEKFTAAQDKWQAAATQRRDARDAASPSLLNNLGWSGDVVGGYLFDAAIAVCVLAGQASLYIVNTFGRVLAMLLYVLGPLAIVFSVPRGVATGTRWFRVFVSVLCWPVLSGLLVGLTVAYALQGMGAKGASEAFEALSLAGLMAVISFAVPVIAASLVGGSMGALSAGYGSVSAWSRAAGKVADGRPSRVGTRAGGGSPSGPGAGAGAGGSGAVPSASAGAGAA